MYTHLGRSREIFWKCCDSLQAHASSRFHIT